MLLKGRSYAYGIARQSIIRVVCLRASFNARDQLHGLSFVWLQYC